MSQRVKTSARGLVLPRSSSPENGHLRKNYIAVDPVLMYKRFNLNIKTFATLSLQFQLVPQIQGHRLKPIWIKSDLVLSPLYLYVLAWEIWGKFIATFLWVTWLCVLTYLSLLLHQPGIQVYPVGQVFPYCLVGQMSLSALLIQ